MKEKTRKKTDRSIFYCLECDHEWFSKNDEFVCPWCKGTFIDEKKV